MCENNSGWVGFSISCSPDLYNKMNTIRGSNSRSKFIQDAIRLKIEKDCASSLELFVQSLSSSEKDKLISILKS
jgi:metal-responsive CopG/Arc/MetJ family transcriptional regulator